MKIADMITTVYKGYILKGLVHDVGKFVKHNLKDIEWDKDYWLHRAGLSTYSPAKRFMGGFSLFALGLCAGGVLALALAPKNVEELRTDIKEKARDFVNKSQVGTEFKGPEARM
jgi:hypothetical protein